MKAILSGLVLSSFLVGFINPAVANEFTDVIDAFDMEYDDPFDINLSIGYERFQRSSLIRRETFDKTPKKWDYFAYQDMYDAKQVTHLLNMELEIGLYKDISLKLRLPVILNDSRELKANDDWDGSWSDINGDGVGDPLITNSFHSPERSGVDYFAVGLWWGILDQGRDDTKPNWTLFAEGRFGVGDILEASCAKAENVPNPETGGFSECTLVDKGGVSRGLNELAFGLRLSRRYGLFDPYFGFEALIGWAKDGTAYVISGNKSGQLNTMPPVVGSLDFGMELIPWEVPEKNLKFTINLGAGGKYHSEGREYTALFDALGTSPYFKLPESTDFDGDSEPDLTAEEAAASWSGMTDVENYATFYGKLVLMIQPAKYVKFHLGMGLGHETEHFITKTDQCKTENLIKSGGLTSCPNSNHAHRPALDAPGNRFRAENTLLWTFLIDATAMF